VRSAADERRGLTTDHVVGRLRDCAALHTNIGQVTATVRNSCWAKADFEQTIERDNKNVSGQASRRTTAGGLAGERRHCVNLVGTNWNRPILPRRPSTAATRSYNMQASASYVTGSARLQRSAPGIRSAGYNQNLRAHADLYQNYGTNAQGIPAPFLQYLLATQSQWQDKSTRTWDRRPGIDDLQEHPPSPRRPLRVHQPADTERMRSSALQHPAFGESNDVWKNFSPAPRSSTT